ncbi:hypothetical protein DNTS_015920 [Danionella cerebrum]|uniref:Suv3 N-terminal domain-containing protein n=1 Tax=Danionella cerebrum TaxID=2873325 RepID=A0A553NM75_9TELE|nr:hypothetical protein DNTS_015920 [Danionella translucida]
MSLNRCIYLLSRPHVRYRVCASRSLFAGSFINTPHATKGRTRESRRLLSSNSSKPVDTSLFIPLTIDAEEGDAVGAELTQALNKSELMKVLNTFYKRKEVQKLSSNAGLDGHIDDIFPYFIRHAKQIFPMLDCLDD